ncbi:MAG: hypothetical protein NTY94_03735 [Alphaproteobacteria bacterium]|nr:hypothetical protein [Alphaproteobacteria bacterium]
MTSFTCGASVALCGAAFVPLRAVARQPESAIARFFPPGALDGSADVTDG